MSRDYGSEIVAAIGANDVQALAKIAIELLGRASKDDERRDRQAEKKRRQRAKSPEMSTPVPGQPETKGGFPPDPLSSKNSNSTTLHRAREAGLNVELVDTDGIPLPLVEETDEAVAAFARKHPVAWPSVNRFLCRRPLRVWLGWIHEMRKQIGGGSQYVEEDLAATCDDDATLTSPIGSPNGLRQFLLHSRMQRLNPNQSQSGTTTDPRFRGRSTAAQRTMANTLEALKDIA